MADIIEKSPRIDPTPVERAREAARKLAEVGIEIGTYRLEPALRGELLKKVQSEGRVQVTARSVDVVAPPEYSQGDIRRIRERLGLSQT